MDPVGIRQEYPRNPTGISWESNRLAFWFWGPPLRLDVLGPPPLFRLIVNCVFRSHFGAEFHARAGLQAACLKTFASSNFVARNGAGPS